ncbi:Monomeric sarcosine oxidase [Bordetella sputigena]|uniref:NAD(P)/FAD-dependent oxidoreductase n=1 Tax=Bordetella sputigena TaxID=1416810 RepID=UPI0039EDEC4A
MKRIATEVAVLGAGLIGSAAALALRQAGIDVVLIDQDAPGAKASGVNFGGVRRQGRAIEQLPLAQRAHDIWPRLGELIGVDGEYVRTGHLKLARSDADLASLEAYRRRTAAYDLGLQILDGAAFRRRFPMFGPEVIGGSLCPEDGQANPRLVAPAYARAAARAGALLVQGERVPGIESQGERFLLRTHAGTEVLATFVINAAGSWGAQVAAWFGEHVPMKVKYPTMAVTEPLAPLVGVSIGVEGGGFYGRQVARGNVVMGGGFGTGLPGERARPGPDAIAALGRNAPRILPGLRHAHIIRFWSGREGYFDDKNPVIGYSRRAPRLLHAFGFSGAGFQISPAVGEVLCELIQGRDALPYAAAYAVDRFPSPATKEPAA